MAFLSDLLLLLFNSILLNTKHILCREQGHIFPFPFPFPYMYISPHFPFVPLMFLVSFVTFGLVISSAGV